MEKKFFVYKIKNNINGKIYIGKTSNISERWTEHRSRSKSLKKKSGSLIHKAIAKYGEENFSIEEIESCSTEQEALNKEIYWIEQLKTNVSKYGNAFGYNLTDGGEGTSGNKPSDETKKKMSASHMGDKNSFYGKKHSIQTRIIMSSKKKGKVSGKNNPRYGVILSEDTRLSISRGRAGKNIGADNARSKLNDEQVIHIKQLLMEGILSGAEIGRHFDVDTRTISAIKCGLIWKHIKI